MRRVLRGHAEAGGGEQRSRLRVGAAAQGGGLHHVQVGDAVVLGAADVAVAAGIGEGQHKRRCAAAAERPSWRWSCRCCCCSRPGGQGAAVVGAADPELQRLRPVGHVAVPLN